VPRLIESKRVVFHLKFVKGGFGDAQSFFWLAASLKKQLPNTEKFLRCWPREELLSGLCGELELCLLSLQRHWLKALTDKSLPHWPGQVGVFDHFALLFC